MLVEAAKARDVRLPAVDHGAEASLSGERLGVAKQRLLVGEAACCDDALEPR